MFSWCRIYCNEKTKFRRGSKTYFLMLTLVNLVHEKMSINNTTWVNYTRNYKHLWHYYSFTDLVYEGTSWKSVTDIFLAPSHEELLALLKKRKKEEKSS